MGDSVGEPELLDVFANQRVGRLDRASSAEDERDVKLIRTYIRAEKEVAKTSGRKPPSIGRSVLTSIWEAPRIGFHREAQKSFPASAVFRNKLLWTPWSEEAKNRWNKTRKVEGLVLEHVTPIDWMWRKLVKLHDDFEDPTSAFHPDPQWGGGVSHVWEDHAAAYLIEYWMVAVLTEEQSAAIDSYSTRTQGFEPNPFLRYKIAEQKMNRVRASIKAQPPTSKAKPPTPFSTARFLIAGHADHTGR